MIRKFIERQKIKRAFKKLVAPEELERILRDGFQPLSYRHGRIAFIVAFVRGESPEDVSKRISRVTDIANTHGAMFHHIIGALVIVAFGTHPNPTSLPKRGNRPLLVQSLQQELTRDIKIVHGATDGHCGLFGENPCSYTFLVPQFDQVLGKLSRLEFGGAAEFP
jgi:hypothetical protein